MDNIEFLQRLSSVNNITNEFERYLVLQQIKKDYKTTEFYKQTKMPFKQMRKEVAMLRIEKILQLIADNLSVRALAQKATEVVNKIDKTAIDNFMNNLSEVLDVNKLLSLSEELKEQLENLQK